MDASAVDTVRQVVEAINDRTLADHAAELIAPTFVRHDLCQIFPDAIGAREAADFVRSVTAAMPDFRLEIEDIFGSGERVTVRLRMTGTHTGERLLGCAATGRRLDASAVFVYRVEGGRLAETWQMVDGLAFWRTAGLLD